MTSAFDTGHCPDIVMRHRLRIAREYAGLEQSELAMLMGTTRATISNAETGKVEPQRTTVNLWAMACGVPVTWIRSGQPPNDDSTHGLGIIRPDDLIFGVHHDDNSPPDSGHMGRLCVVVVFPSHHGDTVRGHDGDDIAAVA